MMDFIKWLAGFVYKTEKKIKKKFRRMPIKVIEKGKYAFIYSDDLDLLQKYGNFYMVCRYDVEKGIHTAKSGRLCLIMRKMKPGEKTFIEKQMEIAEDFREMAKTLLKSQRKLMADLRRKWDEPRQTFIRLNR